jgi:hypothetical protein
VVNGYRGTDARLKKGNKIHLLADRKKNKGGFKKGHIPPQTKPYGASYVDPVSKKTRIKTKGYKKWVYEHILVWEKAHGKVPKGMVVKLIDVKKPSTLDNLELISKTELLERNKLRHDKMPKELKSTTRLIAKLNTEMIEMGK